MSLRRSLRARRKRDAFTLVELLIVVTLILVLVSLLLPAVTAAREAARRHQCMSNLRQLIAAVQQYEMSHDVYPAGTVERQGPILNWPQGYHHGWLVRVLPQLEQQRTWKHVDFQVGVYDAKNLPVRRLRMDVLHCPSTVSKDFASDYAAVHHDREAPIDVTNNGVFFLNSRIRHEQVADGLSNTLFLGEKGSDDSDLGWMSGTRATLRNTAWGPAGTPLNPPVFPRNAEGLPVLNEAVERQLASAGGSAATSKPNPRLLFVGGFGGPHSGGAIYAFGDGSIRFLPETIDPPTYRRLGNRADGELLDMGTY